MKVIRKTCRLLAYRRIPLRGPSSAMTGDALSAFLLMRDSLVFSAFAIFLKHATSHCSAATALSASNFMAS